MLENTASVLLGAIIGYLLMFFVVRLKSHTPKVLSSLISVILGGTVVGFLGKVSNIKEVFSYYVVGLFIGVVVGIVFYRIRYHVFPIMQTFFLKVELLMQTFFQKIGLLTKKVP